MSKKTDALKKISDIAKTNGLTFEEIKNYYEQLEQNHSTKSSFISRLFSYLGGIFIFSGLSIYTGMMWENFDSASRVVITLGPGIICLILALVAIRDKKYNKAFTPLMLIAVFLQPLGIFTFMDEYMHSDTPPEVAVALVFGVVALQQALIFMKHHQTSTIFYAILFGYSTIISLAILFDFDEDLLVLILGFSGICLAYGIDRTSHRSISGFGYFISTIGFAIGAFQLLDNTFDLALIGVASVLIYTSVWAQSRSFLFVSVMVLLGYLGYFTSEYFTDMVGWPIALMILGALFIAISSWGMKLGQKINHK